MTSVPFNSTATWGLGVTTSLLAHVAAATFLVYTLRPDSLPDQPTPKSELQIETQEVAQSQAAEQAPQQTAAAAASTKGSQVSEGAVPESRATPVAPPTETVTAAATPAPKLAEAPPPPLSKPAETKAEALPPVQPAAPALKAAAAPTQTVAAIQSTAAPVKASAAPTVTLAAARPDVSAVKPVATTAPVTKAAQPVAATVQPLTATAPLTTAAAPQGETAPQATPETEQVAAAPADGDHMTAALAWSGDQAQIDPQSLKAISSFMQPGDAAAQSDDVHDALTALLTSVPCSRLQAEFNPATGSMELRGHVPDEALRGPILKALQEQLGSGIKVADAMLILPRPQCGALSGLDGVGLPQSTDQNTNAKLVGADTQAVSYTYRQGQSFALDFVAPDYDAYLYIDYFDAGGQVIHLIPNDQVPLSAHPAKSAIRLDPENGTEKFLNITIGPPYGQEIAAAFAASSPLYDGLRPLSEPAAPYLDWLKARVAEARAKDPDFKGEWVYFFVSTKE